VNNGVIASAWRMEDHPTNARATRRGAETSAVDPSYPVDRMRKWGLPVVTVSILVASACSGSPSRTVVLKRNATVTATAATPKAKIDAEFVAQFSKIMHRECRGSNVKAVDITGRIVMTRRDLGPTVQAILRLDQPRVLKLGPVHKTCNDYGF
jgi:hypothetical protein